jgi:hypothetical protein
MLPVKLSWSDSLSECGSIESASPWLATRSVAAYSQFLRHWLHASRSYFDVETYSFKGPAVYDGTKARDLKVENEAESKFSQTVTNGWIDFFDPIIPAQPARLYRLVNAPINATNQMVDATDEIRSGMKRMNKLIKDR